MEIILSKDAEQLGQRAASKIAEVINKAIEEKGVARIILSTGASQFTTIEALLKEDIDWTKVEMFHLDEYVDLPEGHPASFVKYLKERFVNRIPLKKAYFVDPSNGVEEIIEELTEVFNSIEIDCGVIGIGENSHIAFNDPPADFDTTAVYKVVALDDACRSQQLGEGWFPTFDDVPTHAITMTVHQILKCKTIVSAVPYKVKAVAVQKTLNEEVSNMVPSTKFKEHNDVHLFIDEESASLIDTTNL